MTAIERISHGSERPSQLGKVGSVRLELVGDKVDHENASSSWML